MQLIEIILFFCTYPEIFLKVTLSGLNFTSYALRCCFTKLNKSAKGPLFAINSYFYWVEGRGRRGVLNVKVLADNLTGSCAIWISDEYVLFASRFIVKAMLNML